MRQTKISKTKSNEIIKLIKCSENKINVLFDRDGEEELSLFEEILKTDNNDHGEFIKRIWLECDLCTNDAVLNNVGCCSCGIVCNLKFKLKLKLNLKLYLHCLEKSTWKDCNGIRN